MGMIMKRFLAVWLVMAMLLASGCSNKAEERKTPEPSDITAAILSELSFDDEMLELSDAMIEKQYKLDFSVVESASVYVVGSGAKADEIAVIRVTGEENVEQVKECLGDRADKLRDNFTDYIPEEMPKIEDNRIVVSGTYLLFVVHDEAQQAEKIFTNSF